MILLNKPNSNSLFMVKNSKWWEILGLNYKGHGWESLTLILNFLNLRWHWQNTDVSSLHFWSERERVPVHATYVICKLLLDLSYLWHTGCWCKGRCICWLQLCRNVILTSIGYWFFNNFINSLPVLQTSYQSINWFFILFIGKVREVCWLSK